MSTQQNVQRPIPPPRRRKKDPEASSDMPPALPLSGLEAEKPSAPPTHYLWILRRHLLKMTAFVLGCMLITFIVSSRIKPIYESTATIDVDLGAPETVVGQNSNSSSLLQDPEVYLTTQMRLIQSDAVLRPVAEQFHLIGKTAEGTPSSATSAQSMAGAPVSLGGVKVTRPVNTYLLLVSYRSTDPRLAADVANAIATSYLAQSYSQR